MKKTIYIISLLAILGITACEKEIDPGVAPNHTLAGQWTVKEYDLDMNELYGPSHLFTYNTSFDVDSIWIDNIYDSGVKMKAHVLSETSFERVNGIDVNDALPSNWDVATISISEASIIGDSIIFRVTMYDSAGEIFDDYYEAGHRTTGWDDDTHN